jgi:hypothetical protein
MTIASPLANSFASSFASGDVIVAVASDSFGNIVGFIASNTDANGAAIASDGLFFTYFGEAGACAGIFETDVPFRKVRRVSPPHPRGRTREEVRRFFEREPDRDTSPERRFEE